MTAKMRMRAFIRAVALMMLFLSFFANFIVFQVEIVSAFIRAMITYAVASILLNIVYFIWRITFSETEWKLMVDGPPEKNTSAPTTFDTETQPTA